MPAAFAVTVEVAFTTDPGATPTWTDISDYVRKITTHRGRTGELTRFAAGRATIVLANEDRRFDPTYAAGPYYPNVVPMRRVRIRGTWSGVTYDVFNGYADGWAQTYQHPQEAMVTLSVSDAFKVLANIELAASSYEAEVRADAPVAWWRLGDPAAAATILDSIGTAHLTVLRDAMGVGADLGSAGLVVRDPDTAMTVTDLAGSATGAQRTGGVLTTAPLTVETIYKGTETDGILVGQLAADESEGFMLTVGISGTAGRVRFFAVTAAGVSFVESTVAVNNGNPHHIAGTWAADGTLKVYVDGSDVTSGAASRAVATFVKTHVIFLGGGITTTILDSLTGVHDEPAFYSTALSAARIAAHYQARATAFSGDTSGTRIGRILDWAGWPATDRNIDTGLAVLQGADLGGNALAALQKVEETEQGRLFVADDGKVRFISRDNLLKAPYNTSQGTFGDSGSELEYEDLNYRYDDTLIFNEPVVSRADGVAVRVRDATSQTRYLRRTRVLDGLLHTSDLVSIDLANWILIHYKDPLLRVTDLALHPTAGNETTHFPQVLDRELADRVTVRRKPQNLGATIDAEVLIEGIEHAISAVDWVTKWNLSPAETQVYWIAGVAGASEAGETTRAGF